MTSSITVSEALVWEQLSVCDKVVMKTLLREEMHAYQRNFYKNFIIRDDLQIHFIVQRNDARGSANIIRITRV